MTIYFSVLIAIIGLLVWLMSDNAKAQEIGRISYFAGLLAFLLQVAPRIVDLGR